MNAPHKIVLSASRRTDIPAFYMPWFMERIQKGSFEVQNPFNRRVSIIPATADKVHSIVYWSKNYRSFLDRAYGERLVDMGFHLFFNFTVNSHLPILEPGLPPIENRLSQMKELARRFGPKSIQWRFDPICFFQQTQDGVIENNRRDFELIASHAAEAGICRCVTSFMDPYPKIEKRVERLSGFHFVDPPLRAKADICLDMANFLKPRGISLFTCCEKELLAALPPDAGIEKSACIPNDLLQELHGGRVSIKSDKGQRVAAGCGCMQSKDIGSYRVQPCRHDCLYCYANPGYGGRR